jgi:succinyl-diaminopimelate desuccinylase
MNEITKLIKSLIEFQSVYSKPEEITNCAAFIENYLKQFNIEFLRYDFGGTPSILVVPADRKPQILLMSHFDVVEGNQELFHPSLHNGYLFGRGALDDKYAVALSLVLLKNQVLELRSKGLDQNDLNLGILLTGDEEAGGENGANKVLATIKPDFCIALDGGSLSEIVTKEKGIVQLHLISKGKSTHGARPWLGENAIEILIKDYQEICTHFDMEKPDNWHRTINLAKIEAGHSYNQVPEYAEAILDIRFTENDDIDKLISIFRDSISSDLIIIRKEPLFTSTPSPFLDMLLESNPGIQTACEHGSSDARFLSAHGLNGIVWGANGNLSHHSEKEHVDLESVNSLYRKLEAFVVKSRSVN